VLNQFLIGGMAIHQFDARTQANDRGSRLASRYAVSSGIGSQELHSRDEGDGYIDNISQGRGWPRK
jgi:hypothetical protein